MSEELILPAAGVHRELDDRTVAYILESRKSFDDLRHVASQLAGLLVLAASGGRSASPDHPMLEAAARLQQSASDAILSLQPSGRGQSHHRHLTQASAAIGLALSRSPVYFARVGDDSKIDQVLIPLQEGYAQLRLASAALPGFAMISFEQGCCAVGNSHGKVPA